MELSDARRLRRGWGWGPLGGTVSFHCIASAAPLSHLKTTVIGPSVSDVLFFLCVFLMCFVFFFLCVFFLMFFVFVCDLFEFLGDGGPYDRCFQKTEQRGPLEYPPTVATPSWRPPWKKHE